MDDPSPRNPHAGGFLLAIAILAGAIVGAATGQPSLGVVAGIGAGIVLAVLVWLIDRR